MSNWSWSRTWTLDFTVGQLLAAIAIGLCLIGGTVARCEAETETGTEAE